MSIKRPDWADTGIPVGERRLGTKWNLLDAEGQDAMRKVSGLSREVLDIVAAELRPGITTDYLDEVCHNACIERNVNGTLPQDEVDPFLNRNSHTLHL
jgi:methionyl aminopeptidase